MIKTIFFSIFRSTILTIIISVIAYSIYSPVKKAPIYMLEMFFEPSEKILFINPENPTRIELQRDSQNEYFLLKELEKLVLGLHEYGSVGQCMLEKIKGRVPYTLTKENMYYENIRLALESTNKSNLEKCSIEIKNRINNFFEQRRQIVLNDFNEIQIYNMKYLAETHALNTLIQMGMFGESNMSPNQDDNLNEDRKKIFDQISNNFLNFQLTLDKQARNRISKYLFIKNIRVDLKIKNKKNLNKLSPLIILISFFLIIVFTLIDLIFIKKIKLKKILNQLFR